MKRLFKWLGYSILGLALLGITIGGGAYLMLRNTVAPYSGSAQLAGLTAQVTIVKDQNAIPHIEAENRLDAVRALGWVHASERIWQMEVLRMAGQGRLAEMFGADALSSDRFLRTLGIAEAARASYAILKPETQAYITAYVEGINAWLNRSTGPVEPGLPVEFIILGHTPEPWENWQPVSLLKVMALTLDANLEEEIGRLALAGRRFNPRTIEEMFPANERDTPPELPDLEVLYGFDRAPRGTAAVDKPRDTKLATAPWQLQLPASNNWAISGAKTESGKPLLANDPHLGLTAPSTFYLAHMAWKENGETRNLIGGTLPGVPLVLSGRSDHVAWGLTTTYLDSQDLFLERLNPENPEQYRTADGYAEFDRDETVLKIKGGGEEVLERRRSAHGPVLPMGYERLGELLPEGHVGALSWTGLARDDTTFDGVLAMGEARTVNQFLDATRMSVSPMQSVVAADVDGNIALVAAGRIPLRDPFNRVAGRAPVPGWVPGYGWQGYVDPSGNPRIVNPPEGAVASANSNWLPSGTTPLITYDWAESFRQNRVEELFVRSNRKHSIETMIAGQSDRYSEALVLLRNEILRLLPQGVRLDDDVLKGLAEWDGNVTANSPYPLILTAWHRALGEAVLKDDLGEDFGMAAKGNVTRILAMLRSTGARNWCNDVVTPAVENCGEMVYRAGETALAELREKYGANWQGWRFGDASMTLHEHRPFSRVDALSRFFTIRKEMDGGKYTLLRNSNDFTRKEPYAGTHGSALRTIYDFGDLEKSLFIVSTGQSGNVLSPHYDDMSDRWARIEYLPMVTRPESYRAVSKGVFALVP